MQHRIEQILDLPPGRVSVKATTTEGLGFTGRSEGIAAQAVASVSDAEMKLVTPALAFGTPSA